SNQYGPVTLNQKIITDATFDVSYILGGYRVIISNQGEGFTVGSTLQYYDNSGTLTSLAGTTITSSTNQGGVYSGNYFKVNHFDHGMYSGSNKVILSEIESNIEPTTLTQPVSLSEVSTISVASTSNFGIFEGKSDNTTNTGYLKMGNEIIKYESFSSGGVINITQRGVDSTRITDHSANSLVHKYELGGVSLRRINATHNVDATGIDIDNYYVQFNRTTNGVNRNSDDTPTGYPQISFNNETACGGNNITATENIDFSGVVPHVSILNPGSLTSATGQIRTVSGTSVNGSEQSFIDLGYESVELGVENKLSSSRIVCSEINEQTYLSSSLRNKSFTMKVDLSTTNPNLSPMIFWRETSAEFLSNRLNRPINDYSSDNRVNSLLNDPHAAVYVSNTVRLTNPATSLKVILSAYRHSSADFRVLYRLFRPDSSEVEQAYELFPGYDNLKDLNGDGFVDVITATFIWL
ncbi:MAG: hypothetical protein ACO3UU_11870, partial [Minisyncoccia bacterium]